MPSHIKVGLSVLVVIVGFLMHWYEQAVGNQYLSWLVLGLAVFMVLSIWMFPETGNPDKDKD